MTSAFTRDHGGHPHSGGGRLFLGLALGALLLALALGPPAAAGTVPAADDLLRRAELVRSPELDYAVDFTLLAVDTGSAWKERTAAYSLIAQGKDYSLIMMRKPESFYPGTVLIRGAHYWLLLPRSTKPYQLSSRHVLNGDISNGDLARGNLEAYYTPRLDGEESVRGEECWRLELTKKLPQAMFERIVMWVTKRGDRPWKFEYYGRTGALLRTAYYEDYRQTALGLRSMAIFVQNEVRKSETTRLTFSNLRRIDARGLVFTPQSMQLFRDAALATQTREGRQAEVSELLGSLAATALQLPDPPAQSGAPPPPAAGPTD